MIAELQSHHGSINRIKRTFPEDVRNALVVRGNDIEEILRQLPKQGDQLTEFESTSIGKALSYDDGGSLTKLKDEIGKYLNHDSADFDFKTILAKLFEHSEIAILPIPGEEGTASPALIVQDSFYEDPETQNHNLIKVAALLAKKFGILNFYLPDARTKFTKSSGTLSVFGGYKVLRFLDFGSGEYNNKESIDATFAQDNDSAFLLRRVADYSGACIEHNGTTKATLKYPSASKLESLEVLYGGEPELAKIKETMDMIFTDPDGSPIIRKLPSGDISSSERKKVDSGDQKLAEQGRIDKLLEKHLNDDTPEHIVDLILRQGWLWDGTNKQIILMASEGPESPFRYKINDILLLTRFFTSNSEIGAESYRPGHEPHEALNDAAANRVLGLETNAAAPKEAPTFKVFDGDEG